MMQEEKTQKIGSSGDQNIHPLRDQFDARTDIELPIMNFPSSCDESTLSTMRSTLFSSTSIGKRFRRDRVNDVTSGIQMRGFHGNATADDDEDYDDNSPSHHVPHLKGSMDEESASVVSADSFARRYGIGIVNSWNSTRMLGYVICALAITSLLTIVSLSRGDHSLLHSFSSLPSSSSSPLSPEDFGSRITISAAAAAAFSSSHGAQNSNELNPISLDSDSTTTVMAESKCSKFMGSIEEGSFSFKVRFSIPVFRVLLFSSYLFSFCHCPFPIPFWIFCRCRISFSCHDQRFRCKILTSCAGRRRRENRK